jgi:hypothetical protein
MLINCVAYENGAKLADIPVADISNYIERPGCFVWVALADATPAELEEMRGEFGLHALAVEDALHGHQRPKIEEYGSSLFAVMHLLEPEPERPGHFNHGEVDVFVGPNFVLSVRNRSKRGFLGVRERCENEPELLRHGSGFVHSMVQFKDASVLAQLGTPDMRVPIACGLAWPRRIASGAAPLDFARLAALTFEEADAVRFPGLHLSWQALRATEGTTAVLNASNEIAVAAFLERRLAFDRIHAVNLRTLESLAPPTLGSLDDLLALDAQAREVAQSVARQWSL